MVKYLFLTVFCISIANYGEAKNYEAIDSKMQAHYGKSVSDIANYINKNFVTDADKLRAAYSWVSQHISYDVAKMYTGVTYKHESEVIDKVLQTRKTICFGYTVTLKAITDKLGLNVIIIKGYTKQNNKIDDVQHVWCATKTDNGWLLIDPAWSAGYIASNKFNKKFNDKWYLVQPNEFIKSHIPFDPVWQFSYFPINNKEFYDANSADSVSSRYFNFTDTIKIIGEMPETERLQAENRRIRSSGVVNAMIRKELERNTNYIEYLQSNGNINNYNTAINLYNEAVVLFNKNKYNDAQLMLKSSSGILDDIKNADSQLSSQIKKLRKSIKDVETHIKN